MKAAIIAILVCRFERMHLSKFLFGWKIPRAGEEAQRNFGTWNHFRYRVTLSWTVALMRWPLRPVHGACVQIKASQTGVTTLHLEN